MHMVAEGVKMSAIAHELAGRHGLEMPIHDEIHRVVTGTQDAVTAYRGLRIEPGHESEPG